MSTKVFKLFRIHLENLKGKGLLKTSIERQDRMDRLLTGYEGKECWERGVKNQWSDVKVGALLPPPLGKLKNPRVIGEQGVLGMNKKHGTCFLPSRK